MIEYHCPKCFQIPIFNIQKNYESLEIKCINNHIFNYTISEFLNINPFQTSILKCNHCSSNENNINNLYYCIGCKVYVCRIDISNFHENCKKIIPAEQLYCTCLEHNSPYYKLCIDCGNEVCIYCIIKAHKNHILSEDFNEIIDIIKYLERNEGIEKYLIEKLIDKNNTQYKEKIKIIYMNFMGFLEFLKKIFYNEMLNNRFSNIIYINLFLIYHALEKLKRNIKLSIKDTFNAINIHESYNSLEQLITLLLGLYQNSYESVIYNSKKNIFLQKYSQFHGKGFGKVVLKILKENKIEEMEMIIRNLSFLCLVDLPKNIPTTNKTIPKTNSNEILSPYNSLFNTMLNNKKINYLSYEDLICNLKKKINLKNSERNVKASIGLILDNGYMLFIVNNYDFINLNNRGGLEHALILINPQKQCKEVVNLTYRKCRKFYLKKIYKNIFMAGGYEYMYFYEFLEKEENVQLLCINYKNLFKIYNSFEFTKECCILFTNKGILFYNWKKDQILRCLSLPIDKLEKDLILINKMMFAGIYDNKFILYNLIDNKFEDLQIPLYKQSKFVNLNNSCYFVFFNESKEYSLLRINDGSYDLWNSSETFDDDKKNEMKEFIYSG